MFTPEILIPFSVLCISLSIYGILAGIKRERMRLAPVQGATRPLTLRPEVGARTYSLVMITHLIKASGTIAIISLIALVHFAQDRMDDVRGTPRTTLPAGDYHLLYREPHGGVALVVPADGKPIYYTGWDVPDKADTCFRLNVASINDGYIDAVDTFRCPRAEK